MNDSNKIHKKRTMGTVIKVTIKKELTHTKEDDTMPTIEMMQQTRISYISDMQKYVENLKSLPKDQAFKTSKKNLISSGIIDENCILTDRYGYSKSIKR